MSVKLSVKDFRERSEEKPAPRPWPRRILLTGYRATGKTSVGRATARQLGYEFVDTDRELGARMGCTIAEFVAQQGWPAFRELERSLLEELAQRSGLVVATGGGAILHQEAWTRLRQGSLVVWLQADSATIQQRLATDQLSPSQRPSLTGAAPGQEIEQVLAQREPLYRAGSDLALDTVGKTVTQLASRIEIFVTTTGEPTQR